MGLECKIHGISQAKPQVAQFENGVGLIVVLENGADVFYFILPIMLI